MKKRVYHGTTFSNYKKMIEDNFKNKNDYTWNCSDDDNLYFHVFSKYMKAEGFEKNEINYCKNTCIQRAFESAQISSAVNNCFDTKLIVIEMSIDDSLLTDDDSCENMEHVASYTNINNISIENIKKVYISKEGYNPSLKLFYIRPFFSEWNNGLINDTLKDFEKRAIEQIKNVELYPEDFIDIEWEVYHG